MFTIAYHTLGCKVNQYETEKIREALEGAGFETAAFGSRADGPPGEFLLESRC